MSDTAAAPAPPAPTPAPLPLDPSLELPDPAGVPNLVAQPAVPLASPADLLSLLLAPGPVEAADGQALADAGVAAGIVRDYLPVGTLPLGAALRAFAVRFVDPGGAGDGRRVVSRALRRGIPAGSASVQEVEQIAGAVLLVVRPAGGSARVTVLLTLGQTLYGLQTDAGADGGLALVALAQTLVGRQPPPPTAAGVAQELAVTASLRDGLARARARAVGDRGLQPALPAAGTTQAALLDGVSWAIGTFAGPGPGALVFRQRPGAEWVVLGDPGGPGCPRIPAAVRAVWGLGRSCPASLGPVVRPDEPDALAPDASAFGGIGMWIWEVDRSGGVAGILARAAREGIRTVYVKAGDGRRVWPQFARALGPLKQGGLQVCGWQYVYRSRPLPQARVAAAAIRAGADCFVVDAEAEFEGTRPAGAGHVAARRYMRALRGIVGRQAPIGLTSFAYPDRHRTFPYSAFLAPPWGADVLMPQVYWGAFRAPVQTAMARAFAWNDLYGVPVLPIGGTYEGERPADLLAFRCIAAGYGSQGVSYWSWQHTRAFQWPALGRPTACLEALPTVRPYATLRAGHRGDPVVWLQMRLRAWGRPLPPSGVFGPATRAAVAAFQAAQGLPVSGRADPPTWSALLEPPEPAAAAPPAAAPAPASAPAG
ncbi:MAG: hypothetical protein QOK40_3360 [Miltoncostaeaceae bacterium]|nr:hypothetical protein [Miltoncostaeaceae bacterium]